VQKEEDILSRLRKTWNFEGTVWRGAANTLSNLNPFGQVKAEKIQLPTVQVPISPSPAPVKIEQPSFPFDPPVATLPPVLDWGLDIGKWIGGIGNWLNSVIGF
jgi:hypothetical protein